MSSIDEIKHVMKDLFTYVRENFKEILLYVNPYWLALKIIDIFNPFKRQKIIETIIEPEKNEKIKELQITCSKKIIENIIDYIKTNNATSKISMTDISVNVINRNEIINNKQMSYFSLTYEDMKISCNNDILLEIDINNNLQSFAFSRKNVCVDLNKVISFYDIIPEEYVGLRKLILECRKLSEDSLKKYKSGEYLVVELINKIDSVSDDKKSLQYPTWSICDIFKSICKNIDMKLMTFDFEILFRYCYMHLLLYAFTKNY